MNKHIKLLVSVLFIVIIMLTFGLSRFYFDVSKNTGTVKEPTEIVRYGPKDASDNKIFQSDNDLYGIVDANDRIIISPQWNSLEFAENSFCIASKKINNQLLTGCIDYEENIVVPFVYKSIEPKKIGDVNVYTAVVREDNETILYNNSFKPLLNRAWEAVNFKDNRIIFSDNNNKFTYTLTEKDFIFSEAIVNDTILNTDLHLVLSSKVMLSKLTPDMIEKAINCFAAYSAYAFSNDFSFISDTDSNSVSSAYMLFSPQSSVYLGASLKEINEISMYNLKEADGTQFLYVSANVKADIEYSENEAVLTAEREYTLKSKFRYLDTGIFMLSGTIDDMTFLPDTTETEDIPEE